MILLKAAHSTEGMENVTVMLIFLIFLSSVTLLAQDACAWVLYEPLDKRPALAASSSAAGSRH